MTILNRSTTAPKIVKNIQAKNMPLLVANTKEYGFILTEESYSLSISSLDGEFVSDFLKDIGLATTEANFLREDPPGLQPHITKNS